MDSIMYEHLRVMFNVERFSNKVQGARLIGKTFERQKKFRVCQKENVENEDARYEEERKTKYKLHGHAEEDGKRQVLQYGSAMAIFD